MNWRKVIDWIFLGLILVVAIVYSGVITGDRNALNTKLESVQSRLITMQAQFSRTESDLTKTQSELNSVKQTLASTEAELSSTEQMLASKQEELSSTKQTLTETQHRLEFIEALLLSNIKVTNLSISPHYVELGEKVIISATVTNSGGIQISYPAILRINGSEVEKKSVVLNAGENQVVSFTVAKEYAGTYTVELGGLTDTFTAVWSHIINDLAYIKASHGTYTDDADPEADGIDVSINFYDSKSERVYFQDIPVTVTIKLYGYRDFRDWLFERNEELVFQEQFTISHFSEKIRIPFENVTVNPNLYQRSGDIKVIVTTAKQGEFEYSGSRLVMLYAEN